MIITGNEVKYGSNYTAYYLTPKLIEVYGKHIAHNLSENAHLSISEDEDITYILSEKGQGIGQFGDGAVIIRNTKENPAILVREDIREVSSGLVNLIRGISSQVADVGDRLRGQQKDV